MKNLIELIKKNFVLLFRNKTSTIIFILGPMAIVLLLGMAFNTADLYGLKIGAYSQSYNNLSEDLLGKLSEQFTITKSPSSQQCIDGVKLNEWHVCLVFPSDFKITGNNTIEFYVNPMHLNLVYIVTNMISSKVSKESEEISTMLVDTILQRITAIKVEVEKQEPIINDLKNSLGKAKSSISKVSSEFSSLDVTFNSSSLDIGSISEKVEGIKLEIERIDNANANVSDPLVKAAIQSAYDSIQTNLSSLDSEVGNLSESVNEMTSKLEDVASLKSSASYQFESSSLELSQSLAKIASLQDSIKKIKEQVAISMNSATIVKPINTNIKPVTAESKHTSIIFPLLIVLLLMFGGIFLGASLVISEKTSRAYFRNITVPVRRVTFVLASYVTTMTILLIEVAIVLGISYLFTRMPLSPSLILLILLISTVFTFIGLMVGYASKTTEMAMLISIALVSLLLFFSNMILPIEAIAYLKEVAMYNPFTIATTLIKENIMLNIGINLQERYLILLFSYFAVIFALTLIAEKMSKNHV
jgi:ABC-type multidrug transport system permease subunit